MDRRRRWARSVLETTRGDRRSGVGRWRTSARTRALALPRSSLPDPRQRAPPALPYWADPMPFGLSSKEGDSGSRASTSPLMVRRGAGYLLTAPKGSVAVIEGENAGDVISALRAAGPKAPQLFAVRWQRGRRRPRGLQVTDLWVSLTPENGTRRVRLNQEDLERLVRAPSRAQFVSGPSSGGRSSTEPGSPIHLVDVDALRLESSEAL